MRKHMHVNSFLNGFVMGGESSTCVFKCFRVIPSCFVVTILVQQFLEAHDKIMC